MARQRAWGCSRSPGIMWPRSAVGAVGLSSRYRFDPPVMAAMGGHEIPDEDVLLGQDPGRGEVWAALIGGLKI